MRLTTLLPSLLFAPLLTAQWTNDPLLNTYVHAGADATPLSSEAPDGGTYISWFESAPNNYALRMQLVDADGYNVWDDAGVLNSDEPQNTALFRYDLTTDHEGNAIVAFQDERTGSLQVVAYKVTPTGAMAWPQGLVLTDDDAEQGLAPSIGVLANNDLVIAWNSSAGADRWVNYRYVTADGFIALIPPFRIGGDGVKCTRGRVVANMDGGSSILYVQEVGSFPGITSTMYVQRFDSALEAVWPAPVQVSTRTISFFFFPEPFSDEGNGLYVSFTTGNPDNPAYNDVFLQRVLSGGGTWSAEGSRAMDGAATHRFHGDAVFLNEALGVLLAVQVTDGGQNSSGIWTQRFTVGGLRLLGAGGTEGVPVTAALNLPQGIAATDNGAILVYKAGGFNSEHLYALRVGLNGAPSWIDGPTDLSLANSNKSNVWCGPLRDEQVVVTWADDRSAAGIYAQRFDQDGDLDIGTGVQTIEAGTAVAELLDNASAKPLLRTTLRKGGTLTIQAFDALGQLLAERIETRTAGTTVAPLELPDVNGIGILRVRCAEGTWDLRWTDL